MSATPDRRFTSVNLAFNISGLGSVADCNPGGSIICDPGTGGCDGTAMSCVGTSCSNDSSFMGCFSGSDIVERGLDTHILVAREALQELRAELQQVVARFAASQK